MLRFQNVTKGYFGKRALDNVTAEFEAGKVYAMVGPNGSGKSTMMKIAAGFVKSNGGSCTFNGIPVGHKTNANIAYMSTEPFYYDFLKISDVGKYYKDFFDDFSDVKYQELIGFMQLDMNMKVKSLSSGMAAKLKIAATLARNAYVIMLDEPLNGIDILGREQIVNAVIRKSGEGESCLIISSHLFDEIETIVDNVVMLDCGKIILSGNIEVIRNKTNKSIADIYKEIYSGNLQVLHDLNSGKEIKPYE